MVQESEFQTDVFARYDTEAPFDRQPVVACPNAAERELEVFQERFQCVLSFHVGPDLSDEQIYATKTIAYISGLQASGRLPRC